jgi:hypothetical protein
LERDEVDYAPVCDSDNDSFMQPLGSCDGDDGDGDWPPTAADSTRGANGPALTPGHAPAAVLAPQPLNRQLVAATAAGAAAAVAGKPAVPAWVFGAAGLKGQSGATGLNGTLGVAGVKGSLGAAGVNGTPKVAVGLNGSLTAAGVKGALGAAGLNGTAAAAGLHGTPKAAGLNGSFGAASPKGTFGAAGLNGVSKAAGLNGTLARQLAGQQERSPAGLGMLHHAPPLRGIPGTLLANGGSALVHGAYVSPRQR